MTTFGALLDNSSRELVHVVVSIAAGLVLLLGVAVLVPVAILAGSVPGGFQPTSGTYREPSQPRPGPDVQKPGSAAVEAVARRYLGVPYVFGGTDPARGLDCSGLVQLVFRNLGMSLPRTAQLQYNATAHVTRAQLLPGDLVFFARTYDDPHDWITHVGIYIGDGRQINAPTEGQAVSIQPVFSGYWGAHFVSGGRVLTG